MNEYQGLTPLASYCRPFGAYWLHVARWGVVVGWGAASGGVLCWGPVEEQERKNKKGVAPSLALRARKVVLLRTGFRGGESCRLSVTWAMR